MCPAVTAILMAQSDPASSPPASGLVDIVLSGGIIGLVILMLLFALSIGAAYLVFDQIMTLRHGEVLPEGVSDTVRQSLLQGRPAEADAACRRAPSVLGVVLLSGLSELEFGWREVEKAVEDSLAEQAARLMRRIEYLSVIGNIAPMIGLLGTVTGMVFAFQQVATTRGAAGAGDLAEGIYQALVTTVGGLIVAIPSLAAFAICRNRVDSLIAEVAHQAQHALTPIKRRPVNRARAASPAPAAASSPPQQVSAPPKRAAEAAPPASAPPASAPPASGAAAPGKPAPGKPAPDKPAPGKPAPGKPAPRQRRTE